ncbi:MAG: hypothetical protein VX549_04425 [Pseudomonadota bacterium]|nr:hypothetical protein [Pseudomonadota bacterium]
MGKVTRMVLLVVSALAVLAGVWAAFAAHAGMSRFAWTEMDWNSDGTTSLSELLQSADVGKRTIQQDGRECVEYFAFKDGLPTKVVCPSPR